MQPSGIAEFLTQSAPLVMVFFVFYVVVLRPGRVVEGKRWGAVQALQPGDRVLLHSGMLGTFVSVHGDQALGEYEIALADGVNVRVIETAIKLVSPGTTSAAEDPPDEIAVA